MENLTQKLERLTNEINHYQRLLDDFFKDKIKNEASRLAEMAEGFNEYSDYAHHYITASIEELTKLNKRVKEVMHKLHTLRRARQITEKQINGKVAI